MNYKRMAAVALTGALATAAIMAILIWAPIWLIWAAFTPGLALHALWDRWLDRIPALAPAPGRLALVNTAGRPVYFQRMGAGQLRPEEAEELARRDRAQGLLGGVSGAGGPAHLAGPLPPTVAQVIARRAALGGVSGAGGPAHLAGPLPPTVAQVIARRAALGEGAEPTRLADTADMHLAAILAEISAQGPWN
jgi:hypothetical protein